MKRYYSEFKKFITRGNVLDLAVGIIVGGAFSAIVGSLTDQILRPIVNWFISLFIGDPSLPAYTVLRAVYAEDGVTLDLSKSIYIDWGAFISSVFNFLIIALVLFVIVKLVNKFNEGNVKAKAEIKKRKAAIKKYRGQKLTIEQAVAKYEEEEAIAKAKAKAEEEKAAAEAQAEAERLAKEAEEKAMANTRLLTEIRDLLKEYKK